MESGHSTQTPPTQQRHHPVRTLQGCRQWEPLLNWVRKAKDQGTPTPWEGRAGLTQLHLESYGEAQVVKTHTNRSEQKGPYKPTDPVSEEGTTAAQ